MKKMVLLFLAAGMTHAVEAQNKKGNWLIGTGIGSAVVNFGNTEGKRSNGATYEKEVNKFNIGIFPMVGYYFADNAVVGASTTINFSRIKIERGTVIDKTNSTSFALGPFLRVYFGGNSGKGMPFTEIDGAVGYNPAYKNEVKSNVGSSTNSYEGHIFWTAGVKLGYEHFLTETLGLQYYIGYAHSGSNYTVDYTSVGLGLPNESEEVKNSDNNLTFGTGFIIHFRRKSKRK